jgi:hypothetical protein
MEVILFIGYIIIGLMSHWPIFFSIRVILLKLKISLSEIKGLLALWWKKPEYPEKTTDLLQVTNKLYHTFIWIQKVYLVVTYVQCFSYSLIWLRELFYWEIYSILYAHKLLASGFDVSWGWTYIIRLLFVVTQHQNFQWHLSLFGWCSMVWGESWSLIFLTREKLSTITV